MVNRLISLSIDKKRRLSMIFLSIGCLMLSLSNICPRWFPSTSIVNFFTGFFTGLSLCMNIFGLYLFGLLNRNKKMMVLYPSI